MNEAILREANQLPAIRAAQRDYILMDGSGSMSTKWWDSLAAVDAYVQTLREGHVATRLTLATFSGPDYLDLIGRDVETLDQWQPLMAKPIGSTWGGTPLYDAINVMLRKLRDEDPIRCAITIVTDGRAGLSHFTDQTQCTAMLNWAKAKGWSVTFIGCDWDNSEQARSLGLVPSQAIGVQKALLADAARELARKRTIYGATGAPMHWSESEQRQFGGYLAAPTQ